MSKVGPFPAALEALAFTIDPQTKEFADLSSVCDQGSPWRCLIGTSASIHVGRRVAVHLNHADPDASVIRLTQGDYRYERPMTRDEIDFATQFDRGETLSGPLTVVVDLNDGNWVATPKARAGGAKTKANNHGRGSRNRRIRSIRTRQLEAIREAYGNTDKGIEP